MISYGKYYGLGLVMVSLWFLSTEIFFEWVVLKKVRHVSVPFLESGFVYEQRYTTHVAVPSVALQW